MTAAQELQVAAIVAVVVVTAIVIARFELLCLHDLANTPDVELQYLSRAGWTVLIIFVIPLGGIAYLSVGRER